MGARIIYEDEDLYVIYKPAGLAAESKDPSEEDLFSMLRNERAKRGEDTYIGLINRLDQPVEGLCLAAKNKRTAEIMSRELVDHKIKKNYYAIVKKDNVPEKERLVDYLVKDSQKSRARVVDENTPRAKRAVLSYKVKGHFDDYWLLDISLETGRFHQIRAQLAGRNMPILGDRKYGGFPTGRPLCLCAYRICYLDPETGVEKEFCIDPEGEDFKDFNDENSFAG